MTSGQIIRCLIKHLSSITSTNFFAFNLLKKSSLDSNISNIPPRGRFAKPCLMSVVGTSHVSETTTDYSVKLLQLLRDGLVNLVAHDHFAQSLKYTIIGMLSQAHKTNIKASFP